MRIVVDTLIALLLLGILGSVLWQQHVRDEHRERVMVVQQSLTRLYDQMLLQGALTNAHSDEPNVPQRFLPIWFDDVLPTNTYVSANQPWIDVAPPGDMSDHPPDPVIRGPEQAGFWYNPTRRIIRARVEPQLSMRETVRLYNELNSTSVTNLTPSADPSRQPLPNGHSTSERVPTADAGRRVRVSPVSRGAD